MTTVVKRYPTFRVELITEKSSHIIEYDTGKQLTGRDFEESIISFSIKNAMEDDTPVFSLVVLAKEKWDMVIGANDLIRIKVIPDVRKGEPDNPYIMVGLISDIHREGEYKDGLILYRITGMSMAKVLIDFEIGVIQGITIPIADFGWLPDKTEQGLDFSGNTAAGIGDEIMDRFIYEHTEYNFAKNRSLEDFFEHEFHSWEDHEALADVTPFVNYEGNIRQFLEDVSAKPFNELYFEFTKDGKCIALMRPTPFDPGRWNRLPPHRFTSDIVVEESFGKSDTEMHSVYVVHPPSILDFTSMEMGARPKFHPDLIGKYGYTILEVENRYLLTDVLVDLQAEGEASAGGDAEIPAPTYEILMSFLVENEYTNRETLRTSRETVKSEIIAAFPGISSSLANGIIDSILDGTFNQGEYSTLRSTTGNEELDREISAERTAAGEKIELFTQKLYNWYCENANFYSGDIRVIGDPRYRVGSRVLYEDFERGTTWEFYVESVQHEFSFTNGYTTILGVTRGLPNGGKDRFTNMWGKSEDFEGGYLGEFTNAEYLELGQMVGINPGTPGENWSLSGGGNTAMAALNTARQIANRDSVYVFGGGRGGNNPFNSSPVRVDCSSFVWWCYYTHGVSLKGGKTGMTTDTIKVDPQFTTISSRGSSKADAISKLKQGDLVYFDTYKTDGHLGIYAGGGTFIGAQSSTGVASAKMDSGYWFDKFNGRVLRYREA